MTHTHPDDATLQAFALGEMESERAVAVALHIDECPRCAVRVAGADPLTYAFAAVEEPVLPEGLIDDILAADAQLAQAGRGRHAPLDLRREPMVALALMAASTLLFLALGRPTEILSTAVSTAQAAGTMATPLTAALDAVTVLWTLLGAGAFVAAVVVAQRRDLRGPR